MVTPDMWLFSGRRRGAAFRSCCTAPGHVQQPLTEQIQALEQALKVQLFERSRRGAEPTAVGAAILPAVRKFEEQLERLEFSVREAVAG